MEFDSEEMRSVLDKSFPSIKLPFHCDCTSKDMLRKCCEHVWPEAGAKDSNYQYSLVDGSGTSTGHSDFNTDLPNGGKETFAQTEDNLRFFQNKIDQFFISCCLPQILVF